MRLRRFEAKRLRQLRVRDLAGLLRVRTPIWVLPLAPLTLAVAMAGCTGVGNRAYVIDGSENRQAVARPATLSRVGASQQPSWIQAAVRGDGPGDQALASRPATQTIRNLPKSRMGNPDEYTVFGKRYRVMHSAAGFEEQGRASWYGKKFHGRPTSSGEPYDMHELTAAHKHLPIPTFVKVENLDNGREVIVKVNDRGPFVDDRIIDLSYAAAEQLDMTRSGTANVHVEALSVHADEASSALPESASGLVKVAQQVPEQIPEQAPAEPVSPPGQRYIQVGAFHDDTNAHSLLDQIDDRLASPARVAREPSEHQPGDDIFRVHIGPLANARQVRETLTTLADMGLDGYETHRDVPESVN